MPSFSGLSAFLVAFAQVIGTGIAVLIVDKLGRKILLIVSDAVMGLSILALGVFFYLKEHTDVICDDLAFNMTDTSSTILPDCIPYDGKYDPQLIQDLGWLPLASLIIFVSFFSIGKYIHIGYSTTLPC